MTRRYSFTDSLEQSTRVTSAAEKHCGKAYFGDAIDDRRPAAAAPGDPAHRPAVAATECLISAVRLHRGAAARRPR